MGIGEAARDAARDLVKIALLGSRELRLTRGDVDLAAHLRDVSSIGLYLHIPFCRQICPYCPYNKTLYDGSLARQYTRAVQDEIDRYATVLGNKPITSFYIGGGTPTTMLDSGLPAIIEHIHRRLNVHCDVHMESHLNDLSDANLATIRAMGVAHLSMGVEALQDHHLRTLCRSYTAQQAMAAVERAMAYGFTCVNADLIFALPGQTIDEVQQAGRLLAGSGVGQVAAYPLFAFRKATPGRGVPARHSLMQKRRMLAALEDEFYSRGYERTSAWAFTRRGVPRYCSVTVPQYVGVGASAGSYLRDIFYLNTFSVSEYIQAVGAGRPPIALSVSLAERQQMAGWLYWRLYETRFSRAGFDERFGRSLDSVYGGYLRALSLCGFLQRNDDEIRLNDRGAYWLHVLQDLFSIDYVDKLWGTSRSTAWADEVEL